MIKPGDRRRVGQARLLRRQGKTYAEIREVVGWVSDDRLQTWLRGIPRPPQTYRGKALDDLRHECRQLRAEGKTYDEIQGLTGASRGSLSLWLRDMPYARVSRQTDEERQAQRMERFKSTCAVNRELRLAAREGRVDAGARAIGDLTNRELMLVGASIYWAEGAKNKPWRMTDRVTFINSDPTMIAVFLAWLEAMAVPRSRCKFRLQIHESADVGTAARYWADFVGVVPDEVSITLKKHNPKTVRHNTGQTYRGCLIVDVSRPRALYEAIEAAWRGIACSVAPGERPGAD